ncbi:MAG: hypothetical protein AAFP84_06485 [Actinomycetota bacterium]
MSDGAGSGSGRSGSGSDADLSDPDVHDSSWSVERSHGDAHGFHHRPPVLADDRPAVWIHRVTRPAIVVGSSQRTDIVDANAASAAGFEVSGRRSGGGIVVVEPDESCWVDVLIPRGHPQWSDDVNRAFDWVGASWASALTGLGVGDLDVHRGPLVARAHGRVVCFAGIGPGEVVRRETAGGLRKIVGLSQRRTREVARFQGLYLRRWEPDPIRRFVDPGELPDDLDLDAVPAGLLGGPDPGAVADAVVAVVTRS